MIKDIQTRLEMSVCGSGWHGKSNKFVVLKKVTRQALRAKRQYKSYYMGAYINVAFDNLKPFLV